MNRLLTLQDEEWLRDLARVLRDAPVQRRGIDSYREVREDLAEEAVRRLEEIAGVKP